MWSDLLLLWVRRPACLQQMGADECLCLWVSLRMIVGHYNYEAETLNLMFYKILSWTSVRI